MSLGWPSATIIIVLLISLIFRRPITSLMDKTKSLEIELNKIKLEVEENKRKVIEEVQENSKKLIEEVAGQQEALTQATTQSVKKLMSDAFYNLYYGKYMPNNEAYENAVEQVKKYLEDNQSNKHAQIDIKITAVGMAFSWRAFIDHLPDWLESHQLCHFDIQILLSDPEHLDKMPIDRTPKHWAQESRNRITDLDNMMEALLPQQKERVNCTIRTFEAIPQYHGILLNNEHLFLGRTDWIFTRCANGRDPQLTVGENRYRYFHKSTDVDQDRGSERVGLFCNWHKYRWEYRAKDIVVYQRGAKHECEKLPNYSRFLT